MPELPEVETVRSGLAHHVTGKRVNQVMLHRADLRAPFPPDFAKTLAGKRIRAVERRAKYLLIHLEGGITCLAHLGMSGSFRFYPAQAETRRHDHVVFTFEGGAVLVFNDPRRFGLMTLADTGQVYAHPLLSGLGPEPLSAAFTVDYLQRELGKRQQPVKVALMDQALVVGVGNIYASEALFMAGIHPARPAMEAAGRAAALAAAIREVLERAIASGGSSLKDFISVGGEAGYFQHQFHVYGREGKACGRCGDALIRAVQAGRASFYCNKCQK